ncbi:transmembrane and coiled-coil domain-containing protein 4-like isoform X2 [Styela clava]
MDEQGKNYETKVSNDENTFHSEKKADPLKSDQTQQNGDIGLGAPDHSNMVDQAAIEIAANKLIAQLSDPGKFSYLGLCSTVLSLLFGSPEDKVYRHKTVYSLVKHVQLESNCYPTMVAISDGMSSHTGSDVFIKSLLTEKMLKNRPVTIAEDLVLWALLSGTSDGTNANLRGRYDARTRILIRHITWQLHIVLEDLESVEHEMVKMLEACTEKEKSEQEEDRRRNERNRKWKRYALIGLAAAGGGAIIGLTGGLAAPLVAAGAGTILGASSAAALGSVAGLAIITSLFGAAGAGLTGYKMKRRVGGIDEFLFRPLTPGKELNITIAISGWLSSTQGHGDFAIPWTTLRQSHEQYYVVWESEHLIRLGSALEYILDSLVTVAANEALKYTVLSGLVAAVAWPASLLGAASVIDNPWSVCLQRATQVGKELAEVLLSRQHGHRPVTLVGYSLGARVIFHCLEEMAKRKNHSGIIEDVYLLGAPVTGSAEKWAEFSTVIAGHITNGYCRSDWLLKFLYRSSSRQTEVAGLQPVELENRRMINIDLTSVVEGHLDYRKNMPTILSAVGLRSNSDASELANKLSNTNLKARKSQSMPVITNKTVDSKKIPRSESLISSIEDSRGNMGEESNQANSSSSCCDLYESKHQSDTAVQNESQNINTYKSNHCDQIAVSDDANDNVPMLKNKI